ncbi:ankyrin repeat-containing domain protein [Xylaria sp. FL0064]|nr:ankyrin repeat-containing domain protein [Xylaria sp. FL0064]
MINNHSSGPQNIVAGCGPQSNMNGPGTLHNYYGSFRNPQVIEEERLRKEKEEFEREKGDCFRSLSYPDMNSRRDNIDDPHPSTCEWLFTTTEFMEWWDRGHLSTHNGVLWIKGKPGSGKSTLMTRTLSYCERAFADHLIASFFFNARGGVLEKTPLGMLRSITCQLLDKDDMICKSILPSYRDKLKYNGQSFHWKEGELKRFIRRSVTEPPDPKLLLLLVDALDECEEKAIRDVVGFLEDLSVDASNRGVKLSICLSSRHYPWISMKKNLELTVETRQEHGRDIAAYVRDKLIIEDGFIERQIRQKACGIFLWVVLVVAMLNKAYDDGREEAMQKILGEISEDLEGLFERLVPKGDSDKTEFIGMLQWVLFSKQPLTPEQLYTAAINKALLSCRRHCPHGHDNSICPHLHSTIRRRILSSSKGLIEVKGESSKHIVQFIHLSVNDFLCRNKRLEILDPPLQPNVISASHARLWAYCWSYIKRLNNTTGLVSSHVSIYDIKSSWSNLCAHDPFLGYAATWILDHANEALSNDTESGRLDYDITEWLAAKDSWLGCVETAWLVAGRLRLDLLRNTGSMGLMLSLAVALSQNLVRTAIAKGANINAEEGKYGTALHAASSHGNYEAVQLLLDAGADVNVQVKRWGSALQAASAACKRGIVELLLKKGAEINAQGGSYGNALQTACWRGDAATVELLIKKGANVNAQGGYYGNALQAACWRGNPATVGLILRKGANVNAQGGHYGNALQAASWYGNTAISECLLNEGANVNAQGGHHGNALQAAVSGGSYETVKLLLEKGANINAQGGHYGNALQASVSGARYEIMKLLLEKGADINAQSGHYGNALQGAVCWGDYRTVRFLLERGADINAQGGRYGNALLAAYDHHRVYQWDRYGKIVSLLIENGARVEPSISKSSDLGSDKTPSSTLHTSPA